MPPEKLVGLLYVLSVFAVYSLIVLTVLVSMYFKAYTFFPPVFYPYLQDTP